MSVSALPVQPDALFKEILPAPKLSGLVNEAFLTSTPLKAVFLVNGAAKAHAIQVACDPTSEEYEMMDFFVQDFLSLDGVNVGALDGRRNCRCLRVEIERRRK